MCFEFFKRLAFKACCIDNALRVGNARQQCSLRSWRIPAYYLALYMLTIFFNVVCQFDYLKWVGKIVISHRTNFSYLLKMWLRKELYFAVIVFSASCCHLIRFVLLYFRSKHDLGNQLFYFELMSKCDITVRWFRSIFEITLPI